MRCKALASFLLLLGISSKGEVYGDSVVIWGALGQDINLTIPDFQMTDDVDEIRWEKAETLIAQSKENKKTFLKSEAFDIAKNGALQIKKLKRDDDGSYEVTVYGTDGISKLQKKFNLRSLEMVSKPMIYWECSNTTLICEVAEGTDLELKLYQGGKRLNSVHQKVMSHKWTKLTAPFMCQANNSVSGKSTTAVVSCSEEDLHFYIIVGACAGGLLLVVLGALLTFCVCKRKKQNRRRKDEELEIKAPRMSTVERGPKPHSTPVAASQDPVASQAPPPPGHRPLPPSHRTPRDHQQKRRPPQSATKVHQQKGPPLPRPRVQPKPPTGGGEDASLPSPN